MLVRNTNALNIDTGLPYSYGFFQFRKSCHKLQFSFQLLVHHGHLAFSDVIFAQVMK